MKTLQSKAPKRLVTVFAHYDEKDTVDEACQFYLAELKNISKTIIFVSTAKLSQAEQQKALVSCDQVICRPNIGLDFCSYKLGIEQIELNLFDSLLLANDSVYGPLYPLSEILNAFYTSDADVYGATLNFDPQPHIQSFFILFNKKALLHPQFQLFWGNVQPIENKKELILKYEIGLSIALSNSGLMTKAFYEKRYSRLWQIILMVVNSQKGYKLWRLKMSLLKALKGKPLGFNPLHFLAWKLIKRHRVPFIKKELIDKNPAFVNMNPLTNLKKIESSYNTNLVNPLLKRLNKRNFDINRE